jgi:hypothetical protein
VWNVWVKFKTLRKSTPGHIVLVMENESRNHLGSFYTLSPSTPLELMKKSIGKNGFHFYQLFCKLPLEWKALKVESRTSLTLASSQVFC